MVIVSEALCKVVWKQCYAQCGEIVPDSSTTSTSYIKWYGRPRFGPCTYQRSESIPGKLCKVFFGTIHLNKRKTSQSLQEHVRLPSCTSLVLQYLCILFDTLHPLRCNSTCATFIASYCSFLLQLSLQFRKSGTQNRRLAERYNEKTGKGWRGEKGYAKFNMQKHWRFPNVSFSLVTCAASQLLVSICLFSFFAIFIRTTEIFWSVFGLLPVLSLSSFAFCDIGKCVSGFVCWCLWCCNLQQERMMWKTTSCKCKLGQNGGETHRKDPLAGQCCAEIQMPTDPSRPARTQTCSIHHAHLQGHHLPF